MTVLRPLRPAAKVGSAAADLLSTFNLFLSKNDKYLLTNGWPCDRIPEKGGMSVEKISVRKIARVLYVLVLIALACNVIALYLVPTVVLTGSEGLLEGITAYFDGIFFPGEDDIVAAALAFSAIVWVIGWTEFNTYQLVLTLFLVFAGIQTALILWQARRVLKTILRGEPFAPENAVSLRRAAVFCFLIAAAAMARVLFSVCYYRSPRPLATYNALFVPMFAMGGLLCLVMSALFRQAAEIKAENDLTI